MYDEIGCSSHMCLIQKPKGVGTNGPCLCNARKLRLKLTWQDVRIKQLEDGWKRCFFAYGNEVMKETSEKTEERWQKALEDKDEK